jgi:hypothetical protein
VIRATVAALALVATAGQAGAKIALEAPMAGGAAILLHDTAGPCVGMALMAEYVAADGLRVPGCWTKRPGHVAVVFFDGDVGAIPDEALRKPGDS